jgi:hypothetical protein
MKVQVEGFVVRETEAAVAFVLAQDAAVQQVRPLWLPRKKIAELVELDLPGRQIRTAQDGERIGIPVVVSIDAEFADRVKMFA